MKKTLLLVSLLLATSVASANSNDEHNKQIFGSHFNGDVH